ncbi:MAG: hypothetical protein KBD78_10580 [Oligoflexales bacterium]|nr:hypothetical protein [Oligoflexales bacterium]
MFMKILVSTIIGICAANASGQTTLTVEANNVVNLKSDDSELIIEIHHAGGISDICGFKVLTSSDLIYTEQTRLLNLLKDGMKISQESNWDRSWFEMRGSIQDPMRTPTLTYELPFLNLFVGFFKIETVSSKSLKELVESIYGIDDSLILLSTVSCDESRLISVKK